MRLFISDLHLQQERPEISGAFLSFLKDIASQASELYILGDFFEVWIGDDAMDSFHLMIADALRKLAERGCKIYLQHGNRDFLIGNKFCQLAGCTLLPDPFLLEHQGKQILLSHGDMLCTDDRDYQRMKRILSNPLSLFILRRLPLKTRQKLAGDLRDTSRQRTSMKAAQITDVNPQAVQQLMHKHGVNTLIHGHTHRPAIHQLADDKQRIVLGDWEQEYHYLQLDEQGAQLKRVLIEPLLLA